MPRFRADGRAALLQAACLYALLAATLWLYWPGLAGPFMLDDEPHLADLKIIGGRNSAPDIWQFIAEGRASSLGRPVAMASFLLNDNAWPSDPWSFKYTNLMLHGLTGVLLFWLALRLSRVALKEPSRSACVALLAGALWLLHPLNVSTVLYVVQRMTELAALFTVGGLLAYVHGRLMVGHRPTAGYVWMSAGIGLGTVLGTLSKENGALLPLYALIVEFTLLRTPGARAPRAWAYWSFVFLYLPLLALSGYLLSQFGAFFRGFDARPFDMAERLMTQPRTLLNYLSLILIPRRAGTGVYHDDFTHSEGLLDPPYTALALGAMAALLAIAFAVRRKAPVLSFAVLWFFAGHVLESGIPSLELYFEHRNYLPMFGPLFAIAWYGVRLAERRQAAATVALAGFLTLSGVVLWQTTTLWGNALQLATTWASEHPRSVRANQYAAHFWARYGVYDRAEEHLQRVLRFVPNSTGTLMGLVVLDCLFKKKDTRDLDAIIERLPGGTRDFAGPESLKTLVELHADGKCPNVSSEDLQRMADGMLANPKFRSGRVRAQLYYFKARIYAADKQLDPAVRYLQLAFFRKPDVDIALTETQYLMSAGLFEDALAAITKARSADKSGLLAAGLRSNLLDEFEQLIQRLIRDRDQGAAGAAQEPSAGHAGAGAPGTSRND